MKKSIFLSLSVMISIAAVSCYPLPDPPRKGANESVNETKTLTSEEQKELAELREKKKEEEKKEKEEKKQEGEIAKKNEDKEKDKDKDKENTQPKQPDRRPGEYPFANPVPGKEGFVFSPYNNKLVDVRDIASGTLVRDPTYPAEEKKFFRVP